MRGILLALSLVVALPSAAAAQQLIGSYFTVLERQDFFNSRGVRLGDFGAILQQDRANYHRFGLAGVSDQGDPIFWDQGQRARIPNVWRLGPGAASFQNAAMAGNATPVFIEIYGFGQQVSYIVVFPGAG